MIKDLFEFKKKKLKSLNMNGKCGHCYILFDKESPHSECEDCKMKYHEFYCYDKHNCELYNMEDNRSSFSSSQKNK